jgi:hypothetical protein
MDPNLFHVDGERLIEVLFTIVVLSFFVERSLSILFESRFYINRFRGKSLKELIAFSVSALICWQWQFDALSILLVQEKMSIYGEIVTGAVIAGGTKGSVKLFRDLLNVKSSAEEAKNTMAILDKANKGQTSKNKEVPA